MHPGKVCMNLGEGGCQIYDNRPTDPCRNFNCMWRSTEFLGDELRPDLSGAIVVGTKLMEWSAVKVVPTHTPNVPEAVMHRAMLLAAGARVPVVEVSREEQNGEVVMTQTVYGPPEFLEAIQSTDLPTTTTLATAADVDGDCAQQIIERLRTN